MEFLKSGPNPAKCSDGLREGGFGGYRLPTGVARRKRSGRSWWRGKNTFSALSNRARDWLWPVSAAPDRATHSAQMKGRGRPDRCAHAAFDPFDENPRRIDTVAAHFRTSSAIGESQSASKVCEGPIAVITRAIDPE